MMTNFDRIKQMDADDFSKAFWRAFPCSICESASGECELLNTDRCRAEFLKWLNTDADAWLNTEADTNEKK